MDDPTRHKARCAIAACLGLAACVPAAGPQRTGDAAPVVDPGELVALTGDADTAARLVRVAAARGAAVERRQPLPALGLELLTFRLPAGADPDAAIAALEGREPAATVGRNHAYRDAPVAAPAGAPRTYADRLLGWPEPGCRAAQPVGMIDTALDPAGPALAAAEIVTRDFTGGAGAGDTAHGTAVAGLLVGPGRLTGARLYHATVVSDLPSADPAAGVDDIIRAIDWLGTSGVGVVNVSLAGPYNKILDRALAAAAGHGMLVVAAVGNDGAASSPRYPAAFDAAIAVTAVDAALAPYARAPRGPEIDIAAPGVDVYVPGGGYLSGTSIAAPFVTATVAADPAAVGLDPAEVRRRLVAAARDLGPAGRDVVFGAGLVMAPTACGG